MVCLAFLVIEKSKNGEKQMLRIGICDENAKDRACVRKIVTDALFQMEDFTCIEYADPDILEQDIKNKEKLPCDLLIMEIVYSRKSGLKLAQEIRKRDINIDIIFVTNEMSYVYEGYHVHAQGYVLKENMKQELDMCLLQYLEQRRQNKYLSVKSDSSLRSIPINDILYIESNARMLLIHTNSEVILVYGKLTDMEQQVKQYGFLRIHQSYLVQKTCIREINGFEVVVGETRLPISRKYYKDVLAYFKPKKTLDSDIDSHDQTITQWKENHVEDNGAIIGTKGDLLGTIYRIKNGEGIRLGRDDSTCQIVIKEPNVSREHCIIRRLENNCYEIEDCSKNGVYIEGKLIGRGNKMEAYAGNCVWICDETQEFRLG